MPYKTRFARVISFSLARGWSTGFEEWARDWYVQKQPPNFSLAGEMQSEDGKVGAVSEDRMARQYFWQEVDKADKLIKILFAYYV